MDDIEKQARGYLESLREPALPDKLRGRVEQARRLRMRRRLGGATVASVAAAALALALVLPFPEGGPGGADGPAVAEGAPDAPVHPALGEDGERIRTVHAIDRALQAAYDRNAGDDEMEPLWRARQAILLAATPATPGSKG